MCGCIVTVSDGSVACHCEHLGIKCRTGSSGYQFLRSCSPTTSAAV